MITARRTPARPPSTRMSGDTPYRDLAPPPTPEPPPPEMVYEAVQPGPGRLLRWFGPTLLGWFAVTLTLGPLACGVALLVGALYLTWSWRHPADEQLVLSVSGGTLYIETNTSRRPFAEIPLRDLADVVLDTKTIRRVQEGRSVIPSLRFIESTVGPEIDVARIVLVTQEGREIALSTARIAHMEASARLGKIRVFLRKHGWLPEDEIDSRSEDG